MNRIARMNEIFWLLITYVLVYVLPFAATSLAFGWIARSRDPGVWHNVKTLLLLLVASFLELSLGRYTRVTCCRSAIQGLKYYTVDIND